MKSKKQKTPVKNRRLDGYVIAFFHLNTILMTMYESSMPYLHKYIHVHDYYPPKIIIANFGYPVSKFWLRPWLKVA